MSNDLGHNQQQIKSALSYIQSHDRDVWVKMGMAIKAELGEPGFDIWESWASTDDNFSKRDSAAVWKSFGLGGKVTIASVFGLAKDSGWTYEKPERTLTANEIRLQKEATALRAAKAEAEKAAENAAAAVRAQALWGAAKPAGNDFPYLERKGVKAHGLRIGRWEIVDRESGEVRCITENALLVPICDRARKLHSLQAIFAEKLMGGRDKDYLRDGAKSGNFHAIGRPQQHDGKTVFVIVEGYSTGATIHEATGHCVLITFDSSNLLAVAKSVRDRQADAVILIGADNDQWNMRKDGSRANPGMMAAIKAAEEVDGIVSAPPFPSSAGTVADGGPTDWNDWGATYGLKSVADCITAALNGNPVMPPDAPEDEPAPEEDEDLPPWSDDAPQEDPITEAALSGVVDDEIELDPLQKNAYFTMLGYDGGSYFLFSHIKKQVMSATKSDFNEMGYIELAPLNWWELHFPGTKGGVNKLAAAEWLMAVAHSRGVYDPSRIRGRGAWNDAGRSVFHHGSYLSVDGEKMPIEAIPSAYVYPMARSMAEPSELPMTAEEGRWLLGVAEMVRWTMPASAALLAGWTMLAPICGAIKWRPHIWVTGPAGSGKSTVQREFCAALLIGASAYYQGDSSEAGIRQDLKADALPVLIDELESNDDSEKRRVAGVIALVRKSSSESQARTAKGTVSGDGQHYHIRSMFCLASINVNLPGKADIDRLTKLVIRAPGVDGEAHWSKLSEELHKITSDATISRRMLSRALHITPMIHDCITVFTKAAAGFFGTQRHGDQYGTLLAGCWCLTHDTVATAEQAVALIKRYDWREHTEDHDQDDAMEALKAVTNAKVRLGGGMVDVTVYELLREASELHRTGDIDMKHADAALKRHGIRLDKDLILFGTSVPNLKLLLKDASCVTDIRGQLLRLSGATRYNDKTVKFNGAASKCVTIPLNSVLDEPPPKVLFEDEFPI